MKSKTGQQYLVGVGRGAQHGLLKGVRRSRKYADLACICLVLLLTLLTYYNTVPTITKGLVVTVIFKKPPSAGTALVSTCPFLVLPVPPLAPLAPLGLSHHGWVLSPWLGAQLRG